MDIKIVARIAGVEDETTTRQSFWGEVQKRVDSPSAAGFAEQREKDIVEKLPERLKAAIWFKIRERKLGRRWRMTRHIPGMSRRAVMDDDDFVIMVKSIRYGSLEILLDFIAGRNFPLSAADVVQILSMYAPQTLQGIIGAGAPLAISMEHVGGTPSGAPAADADPGNDQARLLRRAFYLANFSLLVPVGLALGILYLAYSSTVAQLTALQHERQRLVEQLLAQASQADKDRSQFVKDVLELAKQMKAGGTDGPRNGPDVGPRGNGPEKTPEPTGQACPGSTFEGGGFRLCFTGAGIDFTELGKVVFEEANKFGSDKIKQVIDGLNAAVNVGKNGVGLASDVVDLWKKIGLDTAIAALWNKFWPDSKPGPSNPGHTIPVACTPVACTPGPPTVTPGRPIGTLFDSAVSFALNSAELNDDTRIKLDEAVKTLNRGGANFPVLIEGHADGRGRPDKNVPLSQRRAEAVRKFLVDNGVAPERLKIHGYGQGYFWLPFYDKASENRRVRIIECTVDKIDRCQSAPEGSQSAHAKQ